MTQVRDLRTRLRWLAGIALLLSSTAGCAGEFFALDASGSPLLVARRGFTSDSCIEQVKRDAARMGVTLKYIHVRGNMVGRSLLWPLEPGYACEAAIGPEDNPSGSYPMAARLPPRGS